MAPMPAGIKRERAYAPTAWLGILESCSSARWGTRF